MAPHQIRWERELARERRQDRRALQRRLAARERWQDRQHYYAQQARRYRQASYDWDDYDYRYLYRNVQPAYFYSASDFLPVGRSAPPAWAPAWGRRYNVPYRYQDVYYDTPSAYYRYGDGGIFQVDPSTGMIEAIVALLAGDLNIGQQLPMGYDAYNLPLQYRDQYVDNDDYIYRYNDGNIYQADAQSGLIENVISAVI